MAGLARLGNAAPHYAPQEHHNPPGRGHRVSRHRHQPARRRRLGDDAIMLRPQLHAGAREAGEVRWSPTILRHRAADWVAQRGRELRLPTRTQRQPETADVGGDAAQHPRRNQQCHHEQ